MKTAISIPDALYSSAEKLADRLGKSRSELYSNAVSDYVERHQDKKVTEKLNEVYANETVALDLVLLNIQTQSSLKNNSW